MYNKVFLRLSVTAFAIAPLFAYAASVEDIMGVVTGLLNLIIPILMIIATVVFLFGVITYITAGGDEDKAATGRSYIIWGLIGLFAMVAVWGLVLALVSTFGVGGQVIPSGVGGL
jgi:uncharacterized membrane protein